jgi:nitrous oxide reductase accessory protein NosL
MFVAKYPVWVTQLHLRDGKVLFFDGVKDLMVFYRSPEKYSAQGKDITEVWVKDYYTLEWLDGRKAFYVIGSDVYGPMGHEFIPFAGAEEAENFKKDHKGTQIIPFDGITPTLLETMRQGQNMRP